MTDQVVSSGPARPNTPPPPPPTPPEPGRAREVHRYPGSPPFGDSELDRLLFRGRAREVDAVLHSVLSYDLLLVYAVSGLGKTSLLTAGVLQPLRDRGYFPVICRLNNPGRPFVELVDAQIREAGRAQGVEVRWMPGADGAAAPTTLWDLLCGLEIWRGNTLQQLVLVLDQFEELFTLGWSGDERTRFIEEFGSVVRRHRAQEADEPPREYELPPPNVKFVLLIREDFLGQLEALAVEVPQIMQHRFRLDGLSPDQTAVAIREPAAIDDARLRTRRFTYSAEAADAILTFLRTKEERGKEVLTPSIDPSQLQIICQHIERVILPAKAATDDAVVEITAQDLGGKQGLDRIVGDFYRREIEDFPRRQRSSLRKLCEAGLISQSGRRLSLEEGEIFEAYHVDRATLADLVDRRLLRSEPRVGSVYYELAHDTLTAPILAYRDEKRAINRRRRVTAVLIAIGVVAVGLVAILAGRLGDEAAKAQSIAAGSDLTDEVGQEGDIAEYELTTTSEEPVIVHVEPGDGLNAVIDVTDPQGFRQSVDRNAAGQPETLVVTNGGAGRYRIEVSGYRSSTGPFDVSVTQAPARAVTVGEAVSATALAGEVSLFEFDVAEADLIIEVTPYDQLDPQLELIDPDGNRVGTVVDDSGAGTVERIVLRSPEPGRYQLLVTPYRASAGQFGLSVRNVDVVDVALGETETESLVDGTDVVVFEFEAPEDQLIAITGRPTNGAGPSLVFDITRPGGGTTSADDSAETGRTVALVEGGARGPYRVFVGTWDGSGGPFELTVREADVTAVAPGAPATLRTTSGLAVVEFTATEHELLTLEATPLGESTVTLEVSGPAAAPVSVEGSSDDPASTLVNPAVSGEYRALVRTDPDIEVAVSLEPPVTSDVTVGEPASGELAASDTEVLTFEATDDRALAVALAGGDDSYVDVEVVDPAGVSTWGTASDLGLADAIIVDGGRGTYSAIVRAYDAASDFELIVQPLDIPDASVGDVVRIEEPGEIAAVDVAADAGGLLAISAHAASATAIGIDVEDPVGTVVASPRSVGVPTTSALVVAGDAGPYRVIVRLADAVGPLDVAVRPVAATPLAPGSTTSGDLAELGDMAVYDVDVPGGDAGPLLVSLVPAAGLRPIVDVEGPDGVLQSVDAGSGGGPVDLVVDGVPGRHRITVRSDGSTGAFDLTTQPIDVVDVAAGATAEGSLAASANAGAVFDVEVKDDGPFTIDVAARDGLDAVVTVIGPAGTIARVDDAGPDEAEQVQVGGPAGTYRTIVAARAPGRFELSVGEVTPESIVVGAPVDGALTVPGDVAVYVVEVNGTDAFDVVVEPDLTLDPIVSVTDPSGVETELDDGASGDEERLTQSSGPGTYQIAITGYEGSTGNFTLTLTVTD